MNNKYPSLHPVEKLSIIYAAVTAAYILFCGLHEPNAVPMLLYRALFIAVTFALASESLHNLVTSCLGSKNIAAKTQWLEGSLNFIRFFFPIAFLGYWYPETFYMHSYFIAPLDPFFATIDQHIFGYQPSIEFSKAFPHVWFTELMCFSYLIYYFIFCGLILYLYFKQKEHVQHAAFVILCSFYLYYLIFILLPVAGPQFHFTAPLNELQDAGFFRATLKFLLESSEKPTGAFPSSHVGITCIALALAWMYKRTLFYILLIPSLCLIAATVYIKAHYFIDVAAGLISVVPMIYVSNKIYGLFVQHKTSAASLPQKHTITKEPSANYSK